MSDKKANQQDWLSQDSFFNSPFPFKDFNIPFKDMESLDQDMEATPSYIEDYVRDTIQQATKASEISSEPSALRYETFDTHHFLFVKCRIPKQVRPENLWLQLNRTQIKINGLPNEKKQIISLPAPIVPSKSIATFKQSSLQIKMPKMPTGRFRDIHIKLL